MYKISFILSLFLLFESCDDHGAAPHQCLGEAGDQDNDGICDDVDDCVGEYDCAGDCEGNSVCFSDIQPILNRACTYCHGISGNSGGLNLSTYDLTILGGVSGSGVVPGNISESEIWNRIFIQADMPPPENDDGYSISDDEIETIRLWIEQGAND